MAHCGLALFSIAVFLHSLAFASSECGSDGRVVLPIGLFASSDVLRTADALPAADLAVQQINDDSDLLPGYCIQQKVFSSKCTFDTAIQDTLTFFSLYNTTVQNSNVNSSEGPSLFIVGGGCPERTEGVAKLTKFLFSLEIDYSLPRPSNQEAAFHIMPMLGSTTLATVSFLDAMGARHFTWFQEIEKETSQYPLPLQGLPDWAVGREIYLLCTINMCRDIGVEPHMMNVSQTVYFLEAHAEVMRETACQAVKLGAVYPKKLWIIYGMEGGAWWEWNLATPTNCSNGEVKKFLDKAITIVPKFDGAVRGTQPAAANTKFAETYRNLQNTNRRHLNVHEPLIYDAVWLTAEALNISLPTLSEGNLTLNSTQRNLDLISVLKSTLENNTYNGLTGSIKFKNSFRSAEDFVVLQYQLSASGKLALVPVANITIDPRSPNATIVFLEGHSMVSMFPNGVPKPPTTVIRVVPWITFGFNIFFCISGVAFAAVCIVLMLVLWNRREMKLTSPRLNLVIVMGGIVWYSSATVIVVPTSDLAVATALCEIRRWGWNIGATLFFVPLLLKNWRVYYIFHNPTQRKMALKDWKLLFVLVVFIIVDVTLLTIFTLIPATRLAGHFENMGPFDKQINCIINESYIAFSILVGYRIVLCIIGCVLSLQNRKVKVPELRESRQVGLATYAFLFTVVVEVALVSAVEDTRILAMLLSLEMQVAATFLLLVLFVPKFYRAFKGGTGQSESMESDQSVAMTSGLESLQRSTLAAMQNENEALKTELKKYQNQTAGSAVAHSGSEYALMTDA